ncbi:MAG: hypothetical protein M1837_002190 [Sclerophora amabilis]|nr:MAG: hypothetical protein M1837_002190 [Sclerophora amabilis]
MPAYLVRGFRWYRQSIRVYVVLANLDDAAADWVMGPKTNAALAGSFREWMPALEEEEVNVRLVEQHDEFDLGENGIAQPYAFVVDKFVRVGLSVDVAEAIKAATGMQEAETETETATATAAAGTQGESDSDGEGEPSKAKDKGKGKQKEGVDAEATSKTQEEETYAGAEENAARAKKQNAAFASLRDNLQPEEKIAWYIIWCGDEVRCFNRDEIRYSLESDLAMCEGEEDTAEDDTTTEAPDSPRSSPTPTKSNFLSRESSPKEDAA